MVRIMKKGACKINQSIRNVKNSEIRPSSEMLSTTTSLLELQSIIFHPGLEGGGHCEGYGDGVPYINGGTGVIFMLLIPNNF